MSTQSRSMHGKVVLVTGGGSGIGRAAAAAFAAAGATVAVAGRRQAAIDETAAIITAQGGHAAAFAADVSNGASVRALVDTIGARFGRLDAAFNNAGTEGRFGPILDLEESDFDEVVAINLKGVWLSMKYQLAAMQRFGNGGAIVNTASWLAQAPVAGASAYAASKGGLAAMAAAVALEAGPLGIRINTLCPGIIDTPMFHRLGDGADLSRFAAVTPLRRAGTPEDVADVAVWLAGDGARFVTGQTIMVDGGYTLTGR